MAGENDVLSVYQMSMTDDVQPEYELLIDAVQEMNPGTKIKPAKKAASPVKKKAEKLSIKHRAK